MTWIWTHTNKEVGQPSRRQGLKARKIHVILADLTASTYGASGAAFPIKSPQTAPLARESSRRMRPCISIDKRRRGLQIRRVGEMH
jgi:hypothetical protein